MTYSATFVAIMHGGEHICRSRSGFRTIDAANEWLQRQVGASLEGRGKKCLQLRMCDDFDGTGWGESGVAYAIETQLRLALEPKP